MTHPTSTLRTPARVAEVGGGVPVKRVLPNKTVRTIGAWCFLDHAGPAPSNTANVGPHPHIGLQTFTWMIEGEILHRDSLGFEQVIRTGQINLMTSGRGISHSEESHGEGALHMVQLWIALPASQREGPAGFQHYPDLPTWNEAGWQHTLLAGRVGERVSPVEVHSPLVGLDVRVDASQAARAPLRIALDAAHEHGILVLRGGIRIDDSLLDDQTLYYLPPGREYIEIEAAGDADVHVLLIGGEPLPQTPIIWWNFVAYSTEEVEEATRAWNAGSERFGTVAGTALERLPAPDVGRVTLRGG